MASAYYVNDYERLLDLCRCPGDIDQYGRYRADHSVECPLGIHEREERGE